jgi:hypothetical protein
MSNELDLEPGVDAIRRSLETDRLILIAGAGVSKSPPAACPTWNDLVDQIIRAGAAAHPEIEPLTARVFAKWNPYARKIEEVCQLIHAHLGTRVIDAFNILVRGSPNDDHESIAVLAEQHKLRAVITTNFDDYIEQALDRRRVPFDLHVGSPPRNAMRKFAVLKPHGSITDAGSMVMTMRQAGRPPSPALVSVMQTALRNHPVLIAGYSANDDDFFPLLIREASTAKRVYWAVWEEMDKNVPAFARRSPQCSIVRCRENSVLRALTNVRHGWSRHDENHEAALLQWGGAIDGAEWTTFFGSLLLTLDPTDDDRRTVIDLAKNMDTQNRLLYVHAQINVALAVLGNGDETMQRKAVDDALSACMIAGRPREYIELTAAAAGHISLASDDPILAPLHRSGLYAGNSFDPYLMGLYMYASGLEFTRTGKQDAGFDYLLKAAGYLLRAGDGATLHKCLQELAKVAGDDLAAQCHRQAAILKETGNIVDDAEPSGRAPLLDRCELAASQWTRKSIAGELALSCFIGLPAGLLGWFITGELQSALSWFAFTAGGAAFGKILSARAIRRYPSIER